MDFDADLIARVTILGAYHEEGHSDWHELNIAYMLGGEEIGTAVIAVDRNEMAAYWNSFHPLYAAPRPNRHRGVGTRAHIAAIEAIELVAGEGVEDYRVFHLKGAEMKRARRGHLSAMGLSLGSMPDNGYPFAFYKERSVRFAESRHYRLDNIEVCVQG